MPMSYAAARSTPMANPNDNAGTTTQAHSRRPSTKRQINQFSGTRAIRYARMTLSTNDAPGIVMPEASSSTSRLIWGSAEESSHSATGEAGESGAA